MCVRFREGGAEKGSKTVSIGPPKIGENPFPRTRVLSRAVL